MRRTYRAALGVMALAIAAGLTTAAAAAEDPAIWLRVEIGGNAEEHGNVKIMLPISLIEVVVDSVDTSKVMSEIKMEKGIDLAKMWRQVRNLDESEFVRIDSDDAKVRVYKDARNFRVTVHEPGFEQPNVEVKIPFSMMDYLFEEGRKEFKLSEMISSLRGQLPLTLVEAKHDGESVTVWLEEK